MFITLCFSDSLLSIYIYIFSFSTNVSELPPNPEADMYEEYNIDITSRLWVGKDYTNFIAKDFVDLDKPFNGGNNHFLLQITPFL